MGGEDSLQVTCHGCTKIIPVDPKLAEAANTVDAQGTLQGQKGADEKDKYIRRQTMDEEGRSDHQGWQGQDPTPMSAIRSMRMSGQSSQITLYALSFSFSQNPAKCSLGNRK